MAKVGAQRAAVLTGKSKSTIQRAMNSGKLSFELDQNKRRVIDVSELERVFGIKQQSLQQPAGSSTTAKTAPVVASSEIETAVEQERMKMQIKMLEQQLSTAEDRIEDLADQRDKWEKQASQVLITSQYSQKQAEDLRQQIKQREELARQRRLQNAKVQNAQTSSTGSRPPMSEKAKELDKKVQGMSAQNENLSDDTGSVFRFWKRAKG